MLACDIGEVKKKIFEWKNISVVNNFLQWLDRLDLRSTTANFISETTFFYVLISRINF